MTRRLPNFFIAGAAKAGTTSLWRYLLQHPAVFMPHTIANKEPCYFCDNVFLCDERAYLDLFAEARPNQIIGEASTYYMNFPESPERIHAAAPDAKIIIMLRNPADRAYSLYNWMAAEGYERLYPFEIALAEERENRWGNAEFRKNPHYHGLCYFHSGLYSEQIERYLDAFPREQVLFLIFEEFIRDTTHYTRSVFEFLDVDPDFKPDLTPRNESGLVHSIRLQHWLRATLWPVLRRCRIPGRTRLQQFLMNMNRCTGRPQPLRRETRQALLRDYEQDIRQTAEIVGFGPAIWLEIERP